MTSIHPHEWAERAACIGYPDDAFFPTEGRQANLARRICATCTVRTDCLTLALTAEAGIARAARYGVFGGLDPTERHQLDPARNQQETR